MLRLITGKFFPEFSRRHIGRIFAGFDAKISKSPRETFRILDFSVLADDISLFSETLFTNYPLIGRHIPEVGFGYLN